MKNQAICTVFYIHLVIYKGKSNSKWSQYTKFPDFGVAMALQKIREPRDLLKTYQNQNKSQT